MLIESLSPGLLQRTSLQMRLYGTVRLKSIQHVRSASTLLVMPASSASQLSKSPKSRFTQQSSLLALRGNRVMLSMGRHRYRYISHESFNTNFIIGVIAANAAVFGAWIYARPRGPRSGSPSPTLYGHLQNYFVLSWSHIRNSNYWPVVGSAFSHIAPGHFAFNMISMWFFGRFLAGVPGLRVQHLANLTFGSAICGSVGFLVHDRYRSTSKSPSMQRSAEHAALGASGVLMGYGAVAACLVPQATALIMGIVPAPLWLCVSGYFLFDVFYLNSENATVAHAGHLGGTAFGIMYYVLRLRRFGGVLAR